jgi:hypothetical protein
MRRCPPRPLEITRAFSNFFTANGIRTLQRWGGVMELVFDILLLAMAASVIAGLPALTRFAEG